MEAELDISESFKVGSWLVSVDTLNREQLIKSCQEWTDEHTKLLLAELEARFRGESILGVDLVRTSDEKLIYAAAMLGKYSNSPAAPAAIGLALIN